MNSRVNGLLQLAALGMIGVVIHHLFSLELVNGAIYGALWPFLLLLAYPGLAMLVTGQRFQIRFPEIE